MNVFFVEQPCLFSLLFTSVRFGICLVSLSFILVSLGMVLIIPALHIVDLVFLSIVFSILYVTFDGIPSTRSLKEFFIALFLSSLSMCTHVE